MSHDVQQNEKQTPTPAEPKKEQASPGKKPRTRVMRKANDQGPVAEDAQSTAESAKAGGGQPMEDNVRSGMENAFGQDFGDVRVHTDGAAADAAKDLNAKAFTQGNDIAFGEGQYDPEGGEGKHLLAHELAHVAQGGEQDQVQEKTAGVSSPGEASEVAADKAADAVMRGEKVGDVGSAPTGRLMRDRLSSLDSSSKGNWYGSVDSKEALKKLSKLSPAEKQALVDDKSKRSMVKRLFSSFSVSQCLHAFMHVPQWDMRWRFRLLDEAGKLDDLTKDNWRWLIGYASPEAMNMVRKYPTGYRAFLKNAPNDLIPDWDKLQGLEDGNWKGKPVDVRNAVNGLNAAQRKKVFDDLNKMSVIMKKCGNTAEKYRTLQYLAEQVKWQVYWLDKVKVLKSLTNQQWAQMLTEATAAEMAALKGWKAMYKLVQKHCPPEVLLITAMQTTAADTRNAEQTANKATALATGNPEAPATAPNVFDDAIQLNATFASLGPAAFLALATRNPHDLDENYKKIRTATKLLPTIAGLELGAKMGTRTQANLKKWFDTPSATAAEMTKMFERRFNLTLTGAGTHPHAAAITSSTWTKAGLKHIWKVCAPLPPSAVEQNPRFLHFLRNSAAGPGSGYYAGPEQQGNRGANSRAEGDSVVGYQNDAQLAGTTATPGSGMFRHQGAFHAGGAGAGSPALRMPTFNATVRHEIGHAVDAAMGIMKTWGRQQPAGGWQEYNTWAAFVDAIIVSGGGMTGKGYSNPALFKRAMLRTVQRNIPFATALTQLGGPLLAADPGGPVSAVWTWDKYRGPPAGTRGSGPWYNHGWNTMTDGRNFQSAYGSANSCCSFIAAERTNRMLTSYQWRAPGEWFAEVYQVYYAEQESNPDAPVGRRVREKDQEAANMIHNLVDRGHSPQLMRGGGTVNAPGT